MNKYDWKIKLHKAIERESAAIPDPSGATPLTLIVETIKQLPSNTSDSIDAYKALIELIVEAENGDDEFWFNLCSLIVLIKQGNDSDKEIIFALRRRFSDLTLGVESRASILSALTDLGFRFNTLDHETEIKRDFPMEWIDAQIAINVIKHNSVIQAINKSLTSHRLPIQKILRRLPMWRQRNELGIAANLAKEAVFWLDGLPPDDAVRLKLSSWFERHGNPLPSQPEKLQQVWNFHLTGIGTDNAVMPNIFNQVTKPNHYQKLTDFIDEEDCDQHFFAKAGEAFGRTANPVTGTHINESRPHH